MKPFLSSTFYTLGLGLDISRVIILASLQRMNSPVFSITDFTGLSILCLPALCWFLIIQDEKTFHKLLMVIAIIKSICSVAAIIFLCQTLYKFFIFVKIKNFKLQLILAFIFFITDIAFFIFSLFRERELCK